MKHHSSNALGRRVSADSVLFHGDVGRLFLMLGEALHHVSRSYYQPPRWDHRPDEVDLVAEHKYRCSCEEHKEEALAIACDIFEALTGKTVLHFGDKENPSGSPS